MDKPKPNKLAQFYSGQIQPNGVLSLRRSVQFWSGVDNPLQSEFDREVVNHYYSMKEKFEKISKLLTINSCKLEV